MSFSQISTRTPMSKFNIFPRISIFGIVCVGFFILNSVILRFLVPLGDEPDYLYRLDQLEDTTRQPFWSPYTLTADWVTAITLTHSPTCRMSSAPLRIAAEIDPQTCTEPMRRAIIRLALLITLTIPLFIIACVRLNNQKYTSEWTAKFRKPTAFNFQTTLSLSLTFPSMVYYLGLLSVEQFVLVLCIIAILAWRSFSLQIALLILAASLDSGNSIVAAGFIIIARIALALESRISIKGLAAALAGLIATAYVMGFYLWSIVGIIPALNEKSNAIYASMLTSTNIEKYPVVMRPVITYMNFVFSTPESLKVPVAYLAVAFALAVCVQRARVLGRRLKKEQRASDLLDMRREVILTLCGISLILTFVFMAPTYANAKYYIFLFPVFLLIPLRVFGKERIFLFSLFITSLVVIQLLLFRV